MTKTLSKWRSVASKLGLFIAVVVFPIASVSVLFSHNIHLPQSSAKQQDLTAIPFCYLSSHLCRVARNKLKVTEWAPKPDPATNQL